MIRLIAVMDGNALCISGEEFKNLQESPCVYVDISKKEQHDIVTLLEELKKTEEGSK